jgi:hypothetical protein
MDGYVGKINSTGTAFDYLGYLGGSGFEQPRRIAIDSAGDAYVAGSTESPDYPVKVGPDLTFQSGPGDAFVTEVQPQRHEPGVLRVHRRNGPGRGLRSRRRRCRERVCGRLDHVYAGYVLRAPQPPPIRSARSSSGALLGGDSATGGANPLRLDREGQSLC